MLVRERRQDKLVKGAALRAQLNEDQLMTLQELERFGWELKFVRRPVFQDPIPVVFDADRKSYCILKPDGTLEESPNMKIRD
jgi:hypothetical protein